MKFLTGCLFTIFLVCLSCHLRAQVTPAAITCKILTENNLPAEGAVIILLKFKDSSIVASAAAGKTGGFKFAALQPGNYLLFISNAGYENAYSGPYALTPGQIFTAPAILLKAAVKQLNEVSVSGTRPQIEAKPGQLTINVQNSLLAQGNSVFDILRQSPGVRVDNGNNISIIGKQNALITINDKPTGLTGDDLAGYLRGIQSNTIDRIELITSGSARYDASSGGIINIVLKKGKNIGFNVTATGSAGYGKYYKSNAGFVFNDRTEKVNIFGSYNYTNDKTFHNFVTDRTINFNDTLSNYNTNYNAVLKHQINTFNFGADFYLSPSQTIGFLLNGSVNNDNIAKNNYIAIYNQSVLDSTITTNANTNRQVTRINYNLNYSAKLDTAGTTITANVDYTTNNRSSGEYITNNFFDAAGNQYMQPLMLQNVTPSNIRIWFGTVDFTGPLSKTSELDAGIKYSNVTSDNDLIFGPLVNGQYTSDPAFSNHFVYTENVNAVYVNYRNKFNKYFNIDADLRVEQTIAKGNSVTLNQVVNDNYTDLFPHALLTYTASDKNEFSLSYGRGITRPHYEELNPFLYYVDRYDYRTGNPNLKPVYSNSIELSYNHNNTLVTTLYSNTLSNAYDFPFYEQNDASKLNITTKINLGTVYNYGIRFFAPVVFTSWWNANFSIDASYQRYVAYPANGNLNKGTQDILLTSDQNFTISKTLTAEISGHYESPTFFGINQFKADYGVDAGISKQLFNKRGSLKFGITDIFNTVHDRTATNYQNLNFTGMDKTETRVAKLVFTYKFGKTTLKTITHHPGNEEEQNRARSSN